MRAHRKLFALLALVFFSTGVIGYAQLQPGQVKVGAVEGEVVAKLTAGQTEEALEVGKVLTQGYTVLTKDDGKCTLIFSNGSTISLKEKSTLNIRKFLQAPYDPSEGNFEDLEKDPSESQTDLMLDVGALVFDVKSLAEKSVYDINNPSGSAGIRGTRGEVAYTLDEATSKYESKVQVFEGKVEYFSKYGVDPTMIEAGASLTVSGAVNPDGTLTVEAVQTGVAQEDGAAADDADAEAEAEAEAEEDEQQEEEEQQEDEEDNSTPSTDSDSSTISMEMSQIQTF